MTKPVRILQVFARMDRGGAESMIMSLYRNIDRSKVQFDFVVHTTKKCAFDDEIRSLGGNIHRIPRYKGKNHFEYKKKWNELFKNNYNYKIIHGHVRSTASIYLKIANKHDLVTIAHSHNTSNGNGLNALVKNILQLPIKDIADYLFAASKEAGIWLFGKKAISQDNFFVFKNAIDTNEFIYDEKIRKEKRNELNINDEVVIGHVGRFHPQKNHSFLIDVFKEYHNLNQNSLLLLIGKEQLKSDIKKKVKEYNIEKYVKFLGVRSDVHELMQAMDVFVFPSNYEGLGIVAIEAQAAGLPIIASDTIPAEVKITDLLKFNSLDNSASDWAKKINKLRLFPRTNTYDDIVDAGYDIKKTTKELQDFYLNVFKEEKIQWH